MTATCWPMGPNTCFFIAAPSSRQISANLSPPGGGLTGVSISAFQHSSPRKRTTLTPLREADSLLESPWTQNMSPEPVTNLCPYCHRAMQVARMSCPSCEISVDADFPAPRLARLPVEHP